MTQISVAYRPFDHPKLACRRDYYSWLPHAMDSIHEHCLGPLIADEGGRRGAVAHLQAISRLKTMFSSEIGQRLGEGETLASKFWKKVQSRYGDKDSKEAFSILKEVQELRFDASAAADAHGSLFVHLKGHHTLRAKAAIPEQDWIQLFLDTLPDEEPTWYVWKRKESLKSLETVNEVVEEFIEFAPKKPYVEDVALAVSKKTPASPRISLAELEKLAAEYGMRLIPTDGSAEKSIETGGPSKSADGKAKPKGKGPQKSGKPEPPSAASEPSEKALMAVDRADPVSGAQRTVVQVDEFSGLLDKLIL